MKLRESRRRRLVVAVKCVLAAVIIGWLVYQLRGQRLFTRLVHEPKRWDALLFAQLFLVSAFCNNMLRWFVLVRTLGLRFKLADAFRLGSLGFLMNQVAPGSVGGDLVKAAFLAREQPGSRPEAVATIVVDRVVGVYAMLLVASGGAWVAGVFAQQDGTLPKLAWTAGLCAAVGTCGLVAFFALPVATETVQRIVGRVPWVGSTLARLVSASGAYRDQPVRLVAAIGLSAISHTLLILAFWLLARGLPVQPLSLSQMAFAAPMALVAGSIPLTPSGLGTFEATLNHLFVATGGAEGDGFLVALAYRVATYAASALAATYYLASRRRLDEVRPR